MNKLIDVSNKYIDEYIIPYYSSEFLMGTYLNEKTAVNKWYIFAINDDIVIRY